MKKILSVLLIAIALLSAVSCSEYEPVKSTKEEKTVVMTMSLGDEEYEIKYELYRALFLNHKSEIDGGDLSAWTDPENINKINSLIIQDAAKIFSAIYICEVGVGFDIYSNKADKLVEEYIAQSVEGTSDGIGFGTYEAYLAYLKSNNLNYSVQDLIYRYYIALDKIGEYYAGTTDNDTREEDDIVYPALNISLDSVRSFYYSESFKRIFYAYLPSKTEQDPSAIKLSMDEAKDQDLNQMRLAIAKSMTVPSEISTGIFLPEKVFNNDLYDNIGIAAFALADGEVSELINIDNSGYADIDGTYILYAMEKSEADFEKYYGQIRSAYMEHCMGDMLTVHAAVLASNVKYAKGYSSVNHQGISM